MSSESHTLPWEQYGPCQPNVISFNAAISDCSQVALRAAAAPTCDGVNFEEQRKQISFNMNIAACEQGVARESHTFPREQDGLCQPD
eukprot:9936588-Karenia_brevis.AAC.1